MRIRRGIVKHIAEAALLHYSGEPANIVVNCTGLASLHLDGVRDTNVYPGRGQIVVVRNEPGYMLNISGVDDGDEEETAYIMQRADGKNMILQSPSFSSMLRRCII